MWLKWLSQRLRIVKGATVLFTFLSSPWGYGDTYLGSGITLDWLGRGFDSVSAFPKHKCVQGEIRETGNSHTTLNYRSGWTSKDRFEETFGKVKGSLNLIIFAGSASVEMLTRLSENTTTASSALEFVYQARDLSLESRSLTDVGSSVLDQPASVRRDKCGDEFIHRVRLGSKLHVVAKLHFRSREEYERYKTTIKIRVLFFTKKKTITEEFLRYSENAVYSLQVVANGGMTAPLQAILDQNPGYCRTQNMDPCIETTEKLFSYLFENGHYADDIKYSDLNVLEFSTQNYSDSGHFLLNVNDDMEFNPEYRILEQKLQIKLQENTQHKERFLAFKAVETDAERIEHYEMQLQHVEENLAFIDTAVVQCKGEPEIAVCRAAVNETLEKLHPIQWD